MPHNKFADRLLTQGQKFVRRLGPAGRLLRERLVERPLQFAGPYLKKGFVMRPLLFSFIVIGIVLIFLGVREYRQSSASSGSSAASVRSSSQSSAAQAARPRDVTCEDFAGKGPGDQAYVRLTDFEFTDHYTHRKGDRGWEVVCVPAVEPRQVDNPAVRVPKVLIKSNQTRNSRDLYELSRRPIEGIAVKGINTLPLEDQSLLRKHYAYLNLDQCWILEVGRLPAVNATAVARGNAGAGNLAGASASTEGSRGGFGKMGGGAGLALIAVGALLLTGRRA